MVTVDSREKEIEEQKEPDENNPSANPPNNPSNNPSKKKTKKKKTVVIGARIHPGETPSSYVCQGMINFLLSDSPVAQLLRESVTFKFIPMLNPDGVFVGNYRTCILGQDLNRCWQETSTHAYPTLAAVKSVIESLSTDKDDEMDMYLDFHAHTGLLGAFVYGNTYSDVYRFQRHTLFPKHLSYCAQDFSLENTAYNKDRNKSGTSRSKYQCFTRVLEISKKLIKLRCYKSPWKIEINGYNDNDYDKIIVIATINQPLNQPFGDIWLAIRFLSAFLNDKVNCYTLEVSFHGYEVQKGNASTVSVYNEEDYLRLGESICHSLLDYYCAVKYIPHDTIPSGIKDSLSKHVRAKVQSAGNGRSPTRNPSANKAPSSAVANGRGKENGNKVSKTKASSQKASSQQQLQPKIVDIKEPVLPS